MPKIKRILINAFFETAKRKRGCTRNKDHVILKGKKCFVIKENMGEKSYCLRCAEEMILKAKDTIDVFISELRS
jgi:hypothetical protein